MPEPLNAPTLDRKSSGIAVGAGGGGAAVVEDPLPDLYRRCVSQAESWY